MLTNRARIMHWVAYGLLAAFASTAVAQDVLKNAADPDSLWNSVQKICFAPTPGAECLSHGDDFIIFQTNGTPHHYLLIPATRITGVESPEFWDTAYPDWLAKAWRRRYVVAKRLGKGMVPQQIGIAINSRYARTQDQLHIHLNCIRDGIQTQLAMMVDGGKIDQDWKDISVTWPDPGRGIQTRVFRARTFEGANLPDDLVAQIKKSSPSVGVRPDAQTVFAATTESSVHGEQVVVLQGQYVSGDPQQKGFAEELTTNCPIK